MEGGKAMINNEMDPIIVNMAEEIVKFCSPFQIFLVSKKTDRKGNPILSFYVQGIAISAQVYITLWQGSNSASVTINPNFNSNRITLEGTLLPSCLSNVVKGRAI